MMLSGGMAALALAQSVATAAETRTLIEVSGGSLGVGERGTVAVMLTVDGKPSDGTLARADGKPVRQVGLGRYETEVLWTGAPWTLNATLHTPSGPLPVSETLELPRRPPDLLWPERMVGVAGATDPVTLDLAWPGQGSLDDVWVATGAGQVASIREEGPVLKVGLKPPASPFPRAVPVLAVNEGSPGAPPAVGVVVLRARTQIPVQTAPGTTVTVQVGGRALDPVVADASGSATVTAWVRPGDDTAQIRLEDPAGNVSTSTIRLGGDPRPHLVGLATVGQVGERDAGVVVAATTASGRLWTGAPPRCATPAGANVPLYAVSEGIWRGPLGADDLQMGSVECYLGTEAQVVVRLPRPVPRPDSVVLRVTPPELDARAPRALVRAWVEDDQGNRLGVAPPTVRATRGVLQQDATADADSIATFRYDGLQAVPSGSDTVRASWSALEGNGPVRDLQLVWGREERGEVTVYGRALDAAGRFLPGHSLVFTLNEAREDGTPTDHGWSTTTMQSPGTPAWLTVRSVQSGRSVGAWVLPRDRLDGPPIGADLTADARVQIITGPVRRVGLQVNPPTLRTLDGQTATVVLELLDREGSPVSDLPVELTTSRGSLSPPRKRPDGTFESTYTPERAGDIGKVEIYAKSPEDHFPTTFTELELVAEDIRRAPGLHVGWMAGSDGISSPWVSIDGDLALGVLPDNVVMRLSGGLYGLRAESTDSSTGQDLAVSADLVPLGVGLVARQPRGRFVTWAGASLLVVPYWVRVSVDSTRGVRGLALAPPGAHAYTGAGLRTRHGEIDLSLGYLFITTSAGEGGWQGGAGGLLPTLGYRHAF